MSRKATIINGPLFIIYLSILSLEKIPARQKLENQVLGFFGAAIMGLIVASINKEHGLQASSIAALKQFLYSYISVQLTFPVHEAIFMKVRESRSWIKETAPILIPVALTSALTFGVHSIRGTPEPIASTIPTLIAAPIAFTILQVKTRIQMNLEDSEHAKK